MSLFFADDDDDGEDDDDANDCDANGDDDDDDGDGGDDSHNDGVGDDDDDDDDANGCDADDDDEFGTGERHACRRRGCGTDEDPFQERRLPVLRNPSHQVYIICTCTRVLPCIGQVVFFLFFILRRTGKNKALAHHTSTYFHTRHVSI